MLDGATGADGPLGPRSHFEEAMLRSNKNNAHDGVVSITANGAAARFAVGLLVVVVLLLSHT